LTNLILTLGIGGKVLKELDGRIKLNNVSFSYPSRADSPIFKDLSLTVDAGSTIAVVGESGSGKRFPCLYLFLFSLDIRLKKLLVRLTARYLPFY